MLAIMTVCSLFGNIDSFYFNSPEDIIVDQQVINDHIGDCIEYLKQEVQCLILRLDHLETKVALLESKQIKNK